MPQTDTVEGIVSAVKVWKTGKGYFLNLEGDDTDYYAFGGVDTDVENTVKLTVKPGTGTFSDKCQITKLVNVKQGKIQDAGSQASKPGSKAVASAQSPGQSGKNDAEIRRGVSLKCASWITAATIMPDAEADAVAFAKDTVELAKKFEPYLKSGQGVK